MDENLFRHKTMNEQKLLRFGFVRRADDYVYETPIIKGTFLMTVKVSGTGKVNTKVVDTATGDEYVLHLVSGACGEFIGKIRKDYEDVLKTVAECCFDTEVFKSENAKRIIQYIGETRQDRLEFLWEKFPDNAIFRRRDNAKWYAALLTVSRRKLIPDAHDEVVEIVDLRLAPEKVAATVDGKRYFPGWHMNKRHWISIILDGSVAWEEIRLRIEESYLLAEKS